MGTIAVPFSYIGSSIYRRRTAADLRWIGERDCRGLRTILRRGERAGETNLGLCCTCFYNYLYCLLSSPRTRPPVKLRVLQANLRQYTKLLYCLFPLTLLGISRAEAVCKPIYTSLMCNTRTPPLQTGAPIESA